MQKTKIIIVSLAILFLAGCAQNEAVKKDTIPDPITNPGGNAQGLVNLEKDMKNNIQNATNAEDQKIADALAQAEKSSNNNSNNTSKPMETNIDYTKQYSQAVIKTNLGNITVKLDAANAPKTVENFLKLSADKFYAGTKFHRVIKGFMIQGGDPNSKESNVSSWGMGGPGYKFADELTGQEKYTQGTLAMANSGPDTNGSQFFIVTADPGVGLPPSYTVFGHVVSGMDVALKIENVKTVSPGQVDRPVEDVVIQGIELVK
jgi:cyclophilin family peptidyl-prolyl cis-trans isomerase